MTIDGTEVYREPDFKYMIIKIRPETVNKNHGDIYQATRCCWKVRPEKVKNYPYVFSAINRIVRKVYVVERWERPPANEPQDRWQFVGHEVPREISAPFIGKHLPPRFCKPGMAAPVLYLDMGGGGGPDGYSDADSYAPPPAPAASAGSDARYYARALRASRNIIFRGAPGTGKTYLAKEVAACVVSGGRTSAYKELTDEEKSRVGFVQFHPSYDYTDFVEGLRPAPAPDGSMGFELRDGVFKAFVDRARRNLEEARPRALFTRKVQKDFVFIIDEINRGEISKIFGELFFSIDPGYRGEDGGVATQYANLHSNPREKFFIPDNVYIIGTMNDIDRSVETFDFAMRRRFRFIEIKADANTAMLDALGGLKSEALRRMSALNSAISHTSDLNKNYQIGASYFLKVQDLGGDFAALWSDFLEPLLESYVQGMNDDKKLMASFKRAYDTGHYESNAGTDAYRDDEAYDTDTFDGGADSDTYDDDAYDNPGGGYDGAGGAYGYDGSGRAGY